MNLQQALRDPKQRRKLLAGLTIAGGLVLLLVLRGRGAKTQQASSSTPATYVDPSIDPSTGQPYAQEYAAAQQGGGGGGFSGGGGSPDYSSQFATIGQGLQAQAAGETASFQALADQLTGLSTTLGQGFATLQQNNSAGTPVPGSPTNGATPSVTPTGPAATPPSVASITAQPTTGSALAQPPWLRAHLTGAGNPTATAQNGGGWLVSRSAQGGHWHTYYNSAGNQTRRVFVK